MKKAIVIKKGFLAGAAVLLILLPVFFGCEDATSPNTQSDPTVTWPTGLTAVYGQTLSDVSLDAHTNSSGTPGAFSWTTPGDSVGDFGAQSHSMTFTPTDTAKYNTLTQNVNITVGKASTAVTTWPTGLTAVYGQTLADIALTSFTNNGTGAFSWDNPDDPVGDLGVQSHSMTFTPTDAANYDTVTDDVTIIVRLLDMAWVEAGSFEMGTNLGTVSSSNTTPVHMVTLTDGFLMGKYEVTQEQYQKVMGTNPSNFSGNNLPVEKVSWYDALVFCNKLSIAEGLSPAYRVDYKTDPEEWGPVPTTSNTLWNAATIVSYANGYRLPTEAQWEYAAKGGNTGEKFTYAGSDTVDDVAWYTDNSDDTTHAVGTKAPNGLGLYDMSGNVYEWCWDWTANYTSGAQTDPTGADSGRYRVIRGGSYYGSAPYYIRSHYRYSYDPHLRDNEELGFRVVRLLVQP